MIISYRINCYSSRRRIYKRVRIRHSITSGGMQSFGILLLTVLNNFFTIPVCVPKPSSNTLSSILATLIKSCDGRDIWSHLPNMDTLICTFLQLIPLRTSNFLQLNH
ncbi:uncharacterized protein LOC111033069 [Myzus persicae]|uniref:uncharacterized protein LOC111033069 n=1 Tax=Myzus persicae TaxID=13164 RepID=UPI000B93855E|nr:uncharacterized protein LOC111033069 [Myzus persicae]XP_022169346.1 uncharacterized protein LOC111033069 [Myzus persicae]